MQTPATQLSAVQGLPSSQLPIWLHEQPAAFTASPAGVFGQRSLASQTPSLSASWKTWVQTPAVQPSSVQGSLSSQLPIWLHEQPAAFTASPAGVPGQPSLQSFTPSLSVSRWLH